MSTFRAGFIFIKEKKIGAMVPKGRCEVGPCVTFSNCSVLDCSENAKYKKGREKDMSQRINVSL